MMHKIISDRTFRLSRHKNRREKPLPLFLAASLSLGRKPKANDPFFPFSLYFSLYIER